MRAQRDKEGQVTRLEDNVKVYVNAVVMAGVTVGRNSIVGAGAVIGRDVPPNVTVMGNPARVVKHLEDRKTEVVKHLEDRKTEQKQSPTSPAPALAGPCACSCGQASREAQEPIAQE